MADTPTKTLTVPVYIEKVIKATMFEPELTYYIDGTRVVRRGLPKPTQGTTAGMTVDAVPYQFQVVRWDDATVTNTAPHVLVKVNPHDAPLHEQCLACRFPITVVDGVLQAPGGLEKRSAGNGRVWYTPHDTMCLWRSSHPNKKARRA